MSELDVVMDNFNCQLEYIKKPLMASLRHTFHYVWESLCQRVLIERESPSGCMWLCPLELGLSLNKKGGGEKTS